MTNPNHMTGPEHYCEAERLLASCQILAATTGDPATYPDSEEGRETCTNALRAAQIHATLALAAASAMPTVSQFMGLVRPDSLGDDEVITQWAKVTGWSIIVGALDFPADRGPF